MVASSDVAEQWSDGAECWSFLWQLIRNPEEEDIGDGILLQLTDLHEVQTVDKRRFAEIMFNIGEGYECNILSFWLNTGYCYSSICTAPVLNENAVR